MRIAGLMLCWALQACASAPFESPPSREAPRNDDLRVGVPENRRDRGAERGDAAAECAQYGRVEQRRGNGEYACVRPGEREPESNWD